MTSHLSPLSFCNVDGPHFEEKQGAPWWMGMQVKVADPGLEMQYRLLGVTLSKQTIEYPKIQKAEPVQYSPLWDFGGWGVRRNLKGDWCYNVSGNEGVKLWLDDERFILLGSRCPEQLSDAINRKK
eukprot:EG_transcript_35981